MAKIKLVKNPKKAQKKKIARSGIGFPYYNLEASVEVAELVHERGGGSCSPDQLASFLGYSGTNSGTYLTRVASARMFGLIVSQHGIVSVTERARDIFTPVMPDDSKKSKVEAFLSVPLFQAVFDKFTGTTLPKTVGLKSLLENQFKIVKARVTPALRILMESAEYAGFFETSGNQTRLIKPVMGSNSEKEVSSGASKKEEGGKQGILERRKGGGEGGEPPTGIHPLFIGLLRELPPAGSNWTISQREAFFHAFKSIADIIYPLEQEDGK